MLFNKPFHAFKASLKGQSQPNLRITMIEGNPLNHWDTTIEEQFLLRLVGVQQTPSRSLCWRGLLVGQREGGLSKMMI